MSIMDQKQRRAKLLSKALQIRLPLAVAQVEKIDRSEPLVRPATSGQSDLENDFFLALKHLHGSPYRGSHPIRLTDIRATESSLRLKVNHRALNLLTAADLLPTCDEFVGAPSIRCRQELGSGWLEFYRPGKACSIVITDVPYQDFSRAFELRKGYRPGVGVCKDPSTCPYEAMSFWRKRRSCLGGTVSSLVRRLGTLLDKQLLHAAIWSRDSSLYVEMEFPTLSISDSERLIDRFISKEFYPEFLHLSERRDLGESVLASSRGSRFQTNILKSSQSNSEIRLRFNVYGEM